jgi:hypothetical protein
VFASVLERVHVCVHECACVCVCARVCVWLVQSRTPPESLFDSCYRGEAAEVTSALENDVAMNLELHGDRGNTLLYTACRGPLCSEAVVRALLQAGASPHTPSSRGSLPQHAVIACFRENSRDASLANRLASILGALDAHYASFPIKNLDGRSAYDELLSCAASPLRDKLAEKLCAAAPGFKVCLFSAARLRPVGACIACRAADKCRAGSRICDGNSLGETSRAFKPEAITAEPACGRRAAARAQSTHR